MCKDEKMLTDLGAAATEVTKALNDLLNHIKQGTGPAREVFNIMYLHVWLHTQFMHNLKLGKLFVCLFIINLFCDMSGLGGVNLELCIIWNFNQPAWEKEKKTQRKNTNNSKWRTLFNMILKCIKNDWILNNLKEGSNNFIDFEQEWKIIIFQFPNST